jgi:hypothetical protein
VTSQLMAFLGGKGFTYVILTLYGMRALSYLVTRHYGPAVYWVCAFGITVAAEFLVRRWP